MVNRYVKSDQWNYFIFRSTNSVAVSCDRSARLWSPFLKAFQWNSRRNWKKFHKKAESWIITYSDCSYRAKLTSTWGEIAYWSKASGVRFEFRISFPISALFVYSRATRLWTEWKTTERMSKRPRLLGFSYKISYRLNLSTGKSNSFE